MNLFKKIFGRKKRVKESVYAAYTRKYGPKNNPLVVTITDGDSNYYIYTSKLRKKVREKILRAIEENRYRIEKLENVSNTVNVYIKEGEK